MLLSVHGRIVLPVILVGVVSLASHMFISDMVERHRGQIAEAQDISLEMIGLAMDASAFLTRVDTIVTQAMRHVDMDEAVRDELHREVDLLVNRIHLSLASYNYRKRGIVAPDTLREIVTIVDEWHENATKILNGKLGTRDIQVIAFIERNGILTKHFGELLDKAHNHAFAVAEAERKSTQSLQDRTTALMMICIVLIIAVAAFLSATFASVVRQISKAMRELAGGNLDVEIKFKQRQDELGDLARSLGVFRAAMADVVHTKSAMEQMALTDALTGLPNRRGLSEFLSVCGKRPGIAGTMIGILHVDLDHFKTINDTMGHDAGDHVLKIASERMSSVIRRSDILARIGGDEFVAVLPDIQEQSAIEALCKRIIDQFETPIVYEDQTCLIGASVGVVHQTFWPGSSNLEELLQNADIALCAVKSAGRGAHRLFDESMGRRREDQVNVARDIARGLAFDEFTAFFQPVVETSTGVVTGIELLARWNHPELGLLTPESFLKAAEAHKLLDELGSQVLERGCELLRSVHGPGQVMPTLHLNISRPQLLSSATIDQLTWILDNASLPPDAVAMEISEATCSGRSAEAALANLSRLRDIGHPIVLDEFGLHNAAVSNIARSGASQIKITREIFTENDLDDPALRRDFLVRAALSVGETLGVSVVAKGPETAEHVAAMRRSGVTEMQGNMIAPPMSAPDLSRWLEERAVLGDGSADSSISKVRRVGR